jgi:glycerol uptake facilitator-like aquaporin
VANTTDTTSEAGQAGADSASSPAPAAAGTGESGRADRADWASRLTAEFVGTAFLLAAVVGSGIMAERLTNDVGLQLFQNAFATAGVLVALILAFAAASGAHFNPAVTLADWLFGGLDAATAAAYVVVQIAGGIVGVMVANVMFELDPVNWSTKDRSSPNQIFAEVVATLGLVLVIYGVVRAGRPVLAAFSVGGYIAGAYYFTSSTSFANPAVTIARTFSDTFAGIRPASAPAFVVAQIVGALLAVAVIRVVYPKQRPPVLGDETAPDER